MSYFTENYNRLNYPIAEGEAPGFYNAQIGAIHALGSHFTLHDEPAVVTMPTGSGKTAVLMTAPFLLRANRILIVTPSRTVRGQIREECETLSSLKKIGVVPESIDLPKVRELTSRIQTEVDWKDLHVYDIVVSTPNCVSPGFSAIPAPTADLFDLVLIDEAHHSPARTWQALIDALPKGRKILFTATPFRRDRKEIKGRFVYSYPVAKAYRDKIFGKIRYIAVNEDGTEANNDIAIARQAEATLAADRASGLTHKLFVRTDSKARAKDLEKIYRENTSLRLVLIHSDHSYRRVIDAIDRLQRDELDGLLCVDMLGEGFDFPNLKVAAIHSPHRSLEVTLQFIGRFARTNAPDIGEAKFLAVPSEIEFENTKLFAEGAVWQEIVEGLSHARIEEETHIRETLQEFNEVRADEIESEDISLYSMNPRFHVKVYSIATLEPEFNATIDLGASFDVFYRNVNHELPAIVLLAREVGRPKWTRSDQILDLKNDLIVAYYDRETHLLFINASRSMEGVYAAIVDAVSPTARAIPMSHIKRVLRDVANPAFFNIGMRNIRSTSSTETYRILAGSSAQAAIRPDDSRLYRQGHAYARGEEDGKPVTIGYSSTAKVWSGSSAQIPRLVEWCRRLGNRIRSNVEIRTNSGFDYLPGGEVISRLPTNVWLAEWDRDVYDHANPTEARYIGSHGEERRVLLADLEVRVDLERSTEEELRIAITGEGVEESVHFTLANFFQVAGNKIKIVRGEAEMSLADYLNYHYLNFYTADGALLRGNEIFRPVERFEAYDRSKIVVRDWTSVDITCEVGNTGSRKSIHQAVAEELVAAPNNDIVIYDHGSGEIADYIVIAETPKDVHITLYHCKGSAEVTPGGRVADMYEVCGQAQKCLESVGNIDRFRKRSKKRIKPDKCLKGTVERLEELLSSINKGKRFEVVVIQPGLLASAASTSILEMLGSANAHVIHGGCEPLRVIAS